MSKKTKEQLLNELAEVQKMLEERTEAQGNMIRKFQMLISNDGLFSQIIDFFPYPLAIFTPQYALTMTNKAFASEIKTHVINPKKEVVRILKHKIDDLRLAAAVTQVFTGKTFVLEHLKNPFSMFEILPPNPDRFNKAIIFPVPADSSEINHGVIVFMS